MQRFLIAAICTIILLIAFGLGLRQQSIIQTFDENRINSLIDRRIANQRIVEQIEMFHYNADSKHQGLSIPAHLAILEKQIEKLEKNQGEKP